MMLILESCKAAFLGDIHFLLQGQLLLDNLVDCTKTYEFEVELSVSYSLYTCSIIYFCSPETFWG